MAWLITGGAGFIGSNLVHRILRELPEQDIVVLDALTYAGNLANLEQARDNPRFRFVRGDITDRDLLDSLFAEVSIDGVFHLAAESHVDRSILDAGAFIKTNVEGTHALLEAARKAWVEQSIKGRFLHVSTDEVFGSLGPADPPFSETTNYAPNSPYSASKAASDHLVRACHHTHGMDTVTTNCSNNFGPWQFPEKMIPVMICNAIEGKKLPVYGDGMNVRDWLYVEDHCEALLTAFLKGRGGETYCIGGDNEVPNIELVHALCDLIDEMVAPLANGPRRGLVTYVKDRPGHDRRYAIDFSKIERELGWRPRHDFRGALRQTVQWYLDHEGWLASCRSGEYREYYDLNYAGRC
ncbi:MAG: dTDP-glucose 4,6-dehydratase [Sumerlaeia bacterium]